MNVKNITKTNAQIANALNKYVEHQNKGAAILNAIAELVGEQTANIAELATEPAAVAPAAPASRRRATTAAPEVQEEAPKSRRKPKAEVVDEEPETITYEDEEFGEDADTAAARVSKARRNNRTEYNTFKEKVEHLLADGEFYIDWSGSAFMLRKADSAPAQAPAPKKPAAAKARATRVVEEEPVRPAAKARRAPVQDVEEVPAPRATRKAKEEPADDAAQLAARVKQGKKLDPDGFDAFFDKNIDKLADHEIDYDVKRGKWILMQTDTGDNEEEPVRPAAKARTVREVEDEPAPRPAAKPRARREVEDEPVVKPAVKPVPRRAAHDEEEVLEEVPVRVTIPANVPKSQHKAYLALAQKYAAEIAEGTHVIRYNEDDDRVFVAKRRLAPVEEAPAPRAAAARAAAVPVRRRSVDD